MGRASQIPICQSRLALEGRRGRWPAAIRRGGGWPIEGRSGPCGPCRGWNAGGFGRIPGLTAWPSACRPRRGGEVTRAEPRRRREVKRVPGGARGVFDLGTGTGAEKSSKRRRSGSVRTGRRGGVGKSGRPLSHRGRGGFARGDAMARGRSAELAAGGDALSLARRVGVAASAEPCGTGRRTMTRAEAQRGRGNGESLHAIGLEAGERNGG
jgi:hypothetical protein